MPVMEKLKMFVVQEPVVAASCLIGGIGLFLPAVVRPIPTHLNHLNKSLNLL